MSDGPRRIAALRAALEVAPDDPDLLRLLASALIDADKPAASIGVLERLLNARPGDPEATLDLARSSAAVGRGSAARAALAALEDAGCMTPDAWRLKAAIVGLVDDGPTEAPAAPPPERVAVARGDALDEQEAADTLVGDGLERPSITFEDVGGMDDLKESIRLKIVYPAQRPELYQAYGRSAGGGLLLFGPPGCGKTYLARATAGEIGASFISVGVADVLDMWVGSSERNMRAIFEVARRHRPSVLFFDEVDALAANRADFRGTAGRTVINQFLAELDGTSGDNRGVLVIGATNAPWHIDSAFRRPGRFDEVVFVPPPDPAARAAILAVVLRDRPARDVDVNAVVAKTDGWSGADLKGLVDRVIERKLAASVRDGKVSPIETRDLLDAVKGIAPTTIEWFSTVRNHYLYANQSGIYDAVRPYIKR